MNQVAGAEEAAQPNGTGSAALASAARSPQASTASSSSSKSSDNKGSSKQRRCKQLKDEGLRLVPGVGPKNEQLFHQAGVTTVGHLLHKYQEHSTEDVKTYIKEEVGIKNTGHLTMILGYLESLASIEAQEPPKLAANGFGQQPKVTLSVEGNISSGKTTFLQILKDSGVDTNLHVVPEPVDKWQKIGDSGVNLLMEFYREPERLAYTFQNYVFLTRMVQERESYSSSMCRLLERSIFSDRMVFVRAVHKMQFMSDTELAIYDSWFDPMLKTLPTLVPNGFIYLRANPETCFRRMEKRQRSEESRVELEYLQELHERHEDWLWSGGTKAIEASKYLHIPATRQTLVNPRPSGLHPAAAAPPNDAPLLSVAQPTGLPAVPPSLRDSLFILDTAKSEKLLPVLNQIPALVLDCDTDVDIDNDEDYKKHVGEQVKLYKAYVGEYMRAKAEAVASQPEPPFNGYYIKDSNGNTVYLPNEWHLNSHAGKNPDPETLQREVRRTIAHLSNLTDRMGSSSLAQR